MRRAAYGWLAILQNWIVYEQDAHHSKILLLVVGTGGNQPFTARRQKVGARLVGHLAGKPPNTEPSANSACLPTLLPAVVPFHNCGTS